MKTITIKLPEDESRYLDEFVREKNYPSKSEFIRNLIMERLDSVRKEKAGWMVLAQKSMEKVWGNKKDDEVWGKYND
ncbi:MAG: ribbon-helix-helix domain-containing protein [Nanoarchaeota archaeon]|nr:ribbon-helix-helix domain-containing protein [Nanoarchaeota archaeon]